MGKKASLKPIGNIYDPKFVMPETEASLQEKPVDFRSDRPKPIGNIYDVEFRMPEEAAREKYERVMEGLKVQRDPYYPIKTSEKDAKERIGIIDDRLLYLENERRRSRNEIKRRNTLGKLFGTDENFKYIKELDKEIEQKKIKRDKIFAEDGDIAAINKELSDLEHERARVLEERKYAGVDVRGVGASGFGLPQHIAELESEEGLALEKRGEEILIQQSELKQKRKQLEYAATPQSSQDVQKIENSMGQYSGNIKNYEILEEFGEDKVNRALRGVTHSVYADVGAQHIEQQIKREDYPNMLTAEYAQYLWLGGDKPKTTLELDNEADSLFIKTAGTEEYRKADFVQKRKILAKAITDELALKYPAISEAQDMSFAKEKIKADKQAYTAYLAQRMMYNDKGDNISLTGLQMLTEHINGDLVDRKLELENQRDSLWMADRKNPNFDSQERARLDEQYGEKNVGLYMEQRDREIKLLEDALQFNAKILDMNPQESRFRQFQKGITSTPMKDLLSAGIIEMNRMLRIADIAEQGESGEISWTESKLLETYGLMNMASGTEDMTGKGGWWFRQGANVSAMIPYVLSFIGTTPAYLAGKAGTKAVVNLATKAVKPALSREIIRSGKFLLKPSMAKHYGSKVVSTVDMAGRMLNRMGGVMAQTTVQPMLQTALARETMPHLQATFGDKTYDDMYVKLEARTPEELKEGKKKAWVETTSEILTERMGAYIMKSLGMAGSALSPKEVMKRYTLDKYINIKKLNNPNKNINRFIRKGMGWNGIVEEYFEEVANYFVANIASGEKAIQDHFWQQQLETLTTVTIFGAAMKGINVGEGWEVLRYGDNVRYTVKDSKGKRNNIVLPRDINDELKEIFELKGGYDNDLMKFIFKHKERLTNKQVNLILNLKANKEHEDWINGVVKKAKRPSLATAAEDLGTGETVSDEFIEKHPAKPSLERAGDDIARDKKKSAADQITEKAGVEDLAAEDEAPQAKEELAFEGTAKQDLAEREFKTDEEKYNQPPADITPDRMNEWIADESNNPSEIHLAWQEESEKTEESELSELESFVLEQKITPASWNRFSDRAKTSGAIGQTWLNKSKGRTLDDLRDEAASMEGIPEDITIQDIVDIMFKFPGNRARKTSPLQLDLERRYREVTGRNVENHRKLNVKETETLAAGEELFGEETVTEGSTRKDGQMEISEKEEETILQHNERMVAEHPDMYKAGLLIMMPGGQLELPTYAELIDHAEQVHKEMSEVASAKNLGEVGFNTENAVQLSEKLGLINRELNKKREEDIPFELLMPSQQSIRLEEEIEQGKKLKGKLTRKGPKIFRLQLEDGRVVKVIDPFDTKEANEAVDIAVLNQEDVGLKVKNDKVFVTYDGTEIGIVEGTNREYEESLRLKREELSSNVQNELRLARGLLRKARGTMASGLPFTPEYAGAMKHLAKAMKYLIQKGFNNLELLISELKRQIRESKKIDISEKPFWIDLIDNNIRMAEDLLRESLKPEQQKAKDIQLSLFETTDRQGLSGEEKKIEHLKIYNEIWKKVAKIAKVSTTDVERKFYNMAQDPASASISNEATYQAFIETYMNESPMMKTLIEVLQNIPFDKIRSAFNFYSGVRLTRQVEVVIDDKGILRIATLNPSDNYQDFIERFYTAIRNYVFVHPNKKTYKGLEGIRKEIAHNSAIALKLRNSMRTFPDKEARTAVRKEQHRKDLELLAKITGQTPEVWSKFFEEKTGNVREAPVDREDKKSILEFDTYQDLLEEDTFYFPKGKETGVWRVQSSLMATLQAMSYKSSDKNFMEGLTSFFLRGKGKSLSNLYQLLTSNQDRDDLGLSGRDSKGDRFNSFIQYSHGFSTSDEIGREIIVLNGIHNRKDNPTKKGTHSAKMSVEDIWFSLAQMYAQPGDTYFQHMGQFGDKSSIYLIQTDKIKPTEDDYKEMKKSFTDFDQAVEDFYMDIIVPNADKFAGLGEGGTLKEQRKDFAREFVYNYASAIVDINAEFHGEIKQYANPKKGVSGIVGMFKRAASTISPGYLLDSNVEGGVGKSYRVLIVDDDALMRLVGKDRVTFREPDGLSIGSEEFFERIAVSMGTLYSKIGEVDKDGKPLIDEGYLTSIKAVHSNVKDGQRGLMKTNNINIRALEMKHKSMYKDLENYMQKHKIDMITFTSGNKHTEVKGYEPAQLFTEDYKFNGAAPKPGQIIERSTADLYVQQDLRHTTTPKSQAMPAQQLANVISLPEGKRISDIIFKLKAMALIELDNKIRKMGVDNLRLEWIRSQLNEYSNPEIIRMLDAGVGINEPSMRNLLRKMLASQATTHALDIPVNKVSQQEIPDIDGALRSRTEFTDKDGVLRVMLPDIAANIKGVRAEWTNSGDFLGRPDLAISHVIANKNQYRDLFDRDGNLMEWEIVGRNGAIPGEPIVSTRVPADDLHSHTVARLKYNMPAGNFTMLDNQSRINSGSDNDGDARYNQVFFKEGGFIILDDTKKGLSNQLLMEMVYGYSDPAMTERINSAVNPEAYDDIVKARRAEQKDKFGDMYEGDLRAYMKAWESNKVGVDMKGIMTDMNTLFSLASTHRIALIPIINPVTGTSLTRFIRDDYGQMKSHIANLLNMAFDNAKDPKIEDMGLNEITVNMFMLGLMTDPTLDSSLFKDAKSHSKAIYDAIEAQTVYFTSDMLVEFTKQMRRKNGGLKKVEPKRLWEIMNEQFKGKENKLRKFYDLSQELPEIRNIFKLAQDAPGTSVELILGFKLMDKVRKNGFTLFDTKGFFKNNSAELKNEYAIIPDMLSFMWDRIFYDSIENTEVGQQVIDFLLAKTNEYYMNKMKPKAQKYFKPRDFLKPQLDTIASYLNNIFSAMAVNKDKSFYEIRRDALKAFKSLEGDGNLFIDMLQIIPKEDGPTLQVTPEFTRAVIPDRDLEAIHKDFDKLPAEMQNIFVRYAFHRFGTSGLRTNGNYYSLISDQKKKEISETNQQEIDNWDLGNLTPAQQYNIAKFIIYAAKDPVLSQLWGENVYNARYADVNIADPVTRIPLDYDALESTEGIIDKQSINDWYNEYGLPEMELEQFGDLLAQAFDVNRKNLSFSKHLIPWAKKVLAARDANIGYFSNLNEQVNDEDLKEMVAEDAVGEALASDDPAIQDFILERMQQMYPEVEFFKDKVKFFDFLRKNGARLHNISPSAIGHALGNAVYADPTKAVQSTLLHEYAHVY